LRLADRKAGVTGRMAGFFLEVPDEFATGSLFGEAAVVLAEYRDKGQVPLDCFRRLGHAPER
jgi:hypothetical protein